MRSLQLAILAIVLILILLPSANAFGAGSIPEYGFLKGYVCCKVFPSLTIDPVYSKAYRHGALENTLERLVRNHAASSGGLFQSILGGSGGKRFSARDIRHVYFVRPSQASIVHIAQSLQGNWLRDYSIPVAPWTFLQIAYSPQVRPWISQVSKSSQRRRCS